MVLACFLQSEFTDGSLKRQMSTKEKSCVQLLHTLYWGIETKEICGKRVSEKLLSDKSKDLS